MDVCVFLADGFETVEALAVVDVLRRANIDTATVSIKDSENVMSAQNIVVKADMVFDEAACMNAKAVFLPGGMPGTLNLENHEGVIRVVKSFYESKKLMAAICAAPSIFGHLGMLEGRKATCYMSFEQELTGAQVVDEPVVVSGHIVTSRGMGTALPLGFELVKILKDEETATKIMKGIHYKA